MPDDAKDDDNPNDIRRSDFKYEIKCTKNQNISAIQDVNNIDIDSGIGKSEESCN